ncbi:molybdenum metabolism regulator [marine bacterium AO1-C]|nr:molybdenum metabolism regulator [marine bacterium AO1-C]
MTKTYLELSQDAGTAHKFYEVIIDGTKVTIRYGRIGTDGTSSTKDYASADAAEKDAAKKIKAKKSKGYEEAVMGQRKKRAISRRAIASTTSSAKKAPVLWKFDSGSAAFGIYIDDKHCWVGNENGDVFKLNHKGEVVNQYKLPDGVKCIIADSDWIYVGCDDGNVYDLTGKLPRKAYEIKEDVDIYWLDINSGLLGVSDSTGVVNVIDYDDEEQWSKKSSGTGGWMVRCGDDGSIYHGHSNGVTSYNGQNGNKLWETKTTGAVLFGWRTDDTVLAGTGAARLHLLDKEGGSLGEMKGDGAFYSCAAAENNEYIFGGDSSSSIYCFDKQGNRLWKLATTCGSAYSMQYHNEKLYIVTTRGNLACIDASAEAIEKAKEGVLPQVTTISKPQQQVAVVNTDELEEADANMQGVLLKCIKEGGKLRVRALSPGYEASWNVQFPKNLRKEGTTYLVDEIRESAQGGFYRVFGNIFTKSDG